MPTDKQAILLDCFGTLVDYEARRTQLGYELTYRYLRDLGFAGAYESFVRSFDVMASGFEGRAEQTLVEFSMAELVSAYLSTYGIPPLDEHVDGFIDRYLDEWRLGVSSIAGVVDLLAELHTRMRVVVVTNTHDSGLPEEVLAQFDLLPHVDAIVTSVGHGRRKPDPSIYEAALDVAGVTASAALFVGDSIGPDYDGPRAASIDAVLVDRGGDAPVPGEHRIASVLELRGLLLG